MNQDAFDTSRVDQQQTDLQSMQWRERYGLNGDPFAEAPGFFFSGGQRQHHLDTLTHLVAFGEMVLLVTGEEGAGKSRMLAELARNAAHRLSVQRLRADTIADVSGIPGMLARLSGQALLGMEPEQAAREFFAWTVTQAQTDRRWVLLIDDADALSDESLEVLVKGFQSAEPGHAAILVLAGSAALASRRVCQDPARSQGIHKVALAPLDIEDVQDFIHASFDQVDGDAGEWLTDSNLQSIHDRSEGNIQAIRRIAPPVLLGVARPSAGSGASQAAKALGQRWSGFRGGAGVRLWGGLALGALGVSLLTVAFQFDSGPRADSDVVMPLDEQVERDFDEVERAREVVVVADESQGELVIDETEAPEPQGIIQRTPESEAAPEGDGFTPEDPQQFRDLAWYQEQPDTHFTIQLLGSFNESTAIEFIEDYDVDGALYTRTRHQGEPWFIVLYGEYEGLGAAREAISGLPQRVRALGPWPRSFSDI